MFHQGSLAVAQGGNAGSKPTTATIVGPRTINDTTALARILADSPLKPDEFADNLEGLTAIQKTQLPAMGEDTIAAYGALTAAHQAFMADVAAATVAFQNFPPEIKALQQPMFSLMGRLAFYCDALHRGLIGVDPRSKGPTADSVLGALTARTDKLYLGVQYLTSSVAELAGYAYGSIRGVLAILGVEAIGKPIYAAITERGLADALNAALEATGGTTRFSATPIAESLKAKDYVASRDVKIVPARRPEVRNSQTNNN